MPHKAVPVPYPAPARMTRSVRSAQDARSEEERRLWPLVFTNLPKLLEAFKDLEASAQAQGSLAQYF